MKEDVVFQTVTEVIKTNKWKSAYKSTDRDYAVRKELQSLAAAKHELSITHENDIILRGSCIVIPSSLRQRVFDLAHTGHQGIVKIKNSSELLWFG